ncbi:MAG: AAA family ATPase [Thiolinea sp.]
MNIPSLQQFTTTTHCLQATGTWRESVHVFDERSAQAIRAALAAGRPLLVRGEPGTGKSQLARAAAKVLGRKFLSHVVDAHTEIQDLWYRFDAVSRLGNAQVLSATVQLLDVDDAALKHKRQQQKIDETLDPEQYLSPGILWWAFAWQEAAAHSCKHPLFVPDKDDPGNEENGVVLLLDEIDKADADLPNSLLETLDNGKFTVPWIKKTIGVNCDGENKVRPLVVITTNEDRQLPGAFIRRCMVLDLRLPTQEKRLKQYLKETAAFHFPAQAREQGCVDTVLERDKNGIVTNIKSRFEDQVLEEAAEQLRKDRKQAESLGVIPPGQAEYLDMLRVLDELEPDDTQAQLKLLVSIKEYALKKYPGMQRAAGQETVAEDEVARE